MGSRLRQLHGFIHRRAMVQLDDGRVGRIVRVDTSFPANETTVTLWTRDTPGPGVTKVSLERVLGEAPGAERGAGKKSA